jgi:hypothetical protein
MFEVVEAGERNDPQGELAGWKPEVLRAVEALQEFDWAGFDPTSPGDLAKVAAAVLNESNATL